MNDFRTSEAEKFMICGLFAKKKLHASCICSRMNYGAVKSAQWNGVNYEEVAIECTQTLQLPTFRFTGAPASAAAEMRDRLIAAFSSCGLRLPSKRIILGFSPRVRGNGESFDLAVAMAVLAAAKIIPAEKLANSVFLGGLGLDGSLIATPGLDALVAESPRAAIVPWSSSAFMRDDQLAGGGGFATLNHVIEFIRGETKIGKRKANPDKQEAPEPAPVRLEDIIGQAIPKRLLELAAAGGHFSILAGPHGWGKSLLARALWGLLPELAETEQKELRRIYASSGLSVAPQRPFLSVDSTHSERAILGGGRVKVGAIGLSHRGVLFLDELLEWPRARLEALRVPLESGTLRPLVIAATNTCPCGRRGSSVHLCLCTPHELQRYQRHLTGALLDRFDLAAEVTHQNPDGNFELPSTAQVRARVAEARLRMARRQGVLNGELWGERPFQVFPWRTLAEKLAKKLFETRGLTRRGYTALARLSLTICDLRGGCAISEADVYEAAHFDPQGLFTRRPHRERP